ncbi:DUF6009 family protein [Streptomyces microflavus]|uniref:DUF6009 family protein n=1 Tax=Streptomyces microflavus TaxID=1919 RepID=UPI0033A397CB
MSALISENEIHHESEFVWLEDISVLDYVRQSLDRLPTRRGRPAYHRDGRMVGYAVLGTSAKASPNSGTFRRRVFWLLPHDRDSAPEGLYASSTPAEAVDPESLSPGEKGRRPTRAVPRLGRTEPRPEQAPERRRGTARHTGAAPDERSRVHSRSGP